MIGININNKFSVVFIAICLLYGQNASGQWEKEDGLIAMQLMDVTKEGDVLYGVGANRMLYSCSIHDKYWREISCVPSERSGRLIKDIEVGDDGAIAVLADSLYVYSPNDESWKSYTDNEEFADSHILDFDIRNSQCISLYTSRGQIFMTTDAGESWVLIGPSWASACRQVVEYSNTGILYALATEGLYVYKEVEKRWERLGEYMYFYSDYSEHPIQIIDDTTIYGTDGYRLYKYNAVYDNWNKLHEWTVFANTVSTLVTNKMAICCIRGEKKGWNIWWSSNDGASWDQTRTAVLPEWGGSEQKLFIPEPLSLEGNTLLFYELYGDMWEMDLDNRSVRVCSYPVSDPDILELHDTGPEVIFYGSDHLYRMDKNTGIVFRRHDDYRYIKNNVTTAIGEYYGLDVTIPADQSDPNVHFIEYTPSLFAGLPTFALSCACQDYAMNLKGELIVTYEEYGLYNIGKYCDDTLRLISTIDANYVSINEADVIIAVSSVGNYEMFNGNEQLIEKDNIPEAASIMDAEIGGNNVVCCIEKDALYAKRSIGNNWDKYALSQYGARLIDVEVDEYGNIFVLDSCGRVFELQYGSNTIIHAEIGADRCGCRMNSIKESEFYVYVATTGCGVYRQAKAKPNSVAGLDVTQEVKTRNISVPYGTLVTLPMENLLPNADIIAIHDALGRTINLSCLDYSVGGSKALVNTKELGPGLYAIIMRNKYKISTVLLQVK